MRFIKFIVKRMDVIAVLFVLALVGFAIYEMNLPCYGIPPAQCEAGGAVGGTKK